MLHEFLTTNRDELIARCRAKVARRNVDGRNEAELTFGISIFLDQLIKTLQVEQGAEPLQSRKVSGHASGIPSLSEIAETASRHGGELLKHGFTLEDVVHDYGDLCQAIMDTAAEDSAAITTDEFRTLNRCLDNAIATAVAEFGYLHDRAVSADHAATLNEKLAAFAHEMRNGLSTATLAVAVIKSGNVGYAGATGVILDRSLVAMRNLIDRSLTEAQMAAGSIVVEPSLFSLVGFISEVKLAATLEASVRNRSLIVANVDPKLAIVGDRNLLLSAVGNLLQNAFKYSRPEGEVTLNAYASGDRILIDVEDSCGGLAEGVADKMFMPFAQMASDRSGVGLGLSISRRGVEANGGTLSVRDVPGTGCVMTINLPRQTDSSESHFSELANAREGGA